MAEQAWSVGRVKARDLIFRSFAQHRDGEDRWYPLRGGSYEDVQAHARDVAHRTNRRVLIIAMAIDATAPAGISEKALLRLAQPWY